MEEFYSMIKALVESTPNDFELGSTVRELIWKIENEIESEYENIQEGDSQITIFDVIAEEDENDAIKGYD